MKLLNEGAIELNDNEVFNNCSYSCYMNIADSLNKLKEYEDIGIEPERLKEFLGNFGISIVMKNTKLMNELQENEEIISKMAKRLKSFEGNTFNSGWIPISERLPNDEECDKYDNSHPLSRKFLCTIKIGDFNPEPRLMFFSKVFGWKYGADDYNKYVIAWQPLPEPYKEVLE